MTRALPPGVRLDLRAGWVMRATQVSLRASMRGLAGRQLTLTGLERVPPSGPLLVCCNHHSYLDPLLVGGFFPRDLHALAKAELYRNPVLRWHLTRCHCIPVHRGTSDRLALRGALAVLAHGGALLVFPEGTRGPRGRAPGLQSPGPGAGFLARTSGAAVLPCAVIGTEVALPRGAWVPRRGPLQWRVGDPLVPTGRNNQEVGEEIMRAIAQLLPPRLRGGFG
ncbi:MAG TPA: lysophospholipid acyltransferase family protein [Verrucomicrobiae bacterium]|nr:lysophospholipid acyltransferase family protein [Verrucomicrobiae bacterium]